MNPTDNFADSGSLEGTTVGGKYLLGRLLGSGGFGEVYEATNVNTGRRVAIKTLHGHLVRHTRARQRFLQEARAATRIEHPNVIDVLDLDIDGTSGVPFIVQEFLLGETLSARLRRTPEQRMSPADALRIVMPVMTALVAAHELGIVHRDLKPDNIFLTRDRAGQEIPKVIDFGIAKVVAGVDDASVTRTGALLGTPAYMSPEQAMGQASSIDAQTDVWAVGVVLYQMLSGRLPYEAEHPNQIVGMLQFRDPVPLGERAASLPPTLVAAVNRAITRDRSHRFPSMQSFLVALTETGLWAVPVRPSHAPEAPSVPPSESPSSVSDGWSREAAASGRAMRSRVVAAGVIAGSLAIAAVFVVLSRPQKSTPIPQVTVIHRPEPRLAAASVAAPPATDRPPTPVPTIVRPTVEAPQQLPRDNAAPQPSRVPAHGATPATARERPVRRGRASRTGGTLPSLLPEPADVQHAPPHGALTPDSDWHL